MKALTGKRSSTKTVKADLVVTAKLFQNGRSQAVRLPKEFRFEGSEVRIRRTSKGILLEPIGPPPFDFEAWGKAMDSHDAGEVIPGGRNQGTTKSRKIFD